MDNTAQNWYIVQENTGICQIIALENGKTPVNGQYWGPFCRAGRSDRPSGGFNSSGQMSTYCLAVLVGVFLPSVISFSKISKAFLN